MVAMSSFSFDFSSRVQETGRTLHFFPKDPLDRPKDQLYENESAKQKNAVRHHIGHFLLLKQRDLGSIPPERIELSSRFYKNRALAIKQRGWLARDAQTNDHACTLKPS